jgi:TPR repeat protein
MAVHWFSKATDKKYPAILFSLSFMCLHGFHFKVDYDKASKYFKLAQKGGYSYAQKFGMDVVKNIKFSQENNLKEVYEQI